jgi:hypothetical protein
LVGKQEEGAPKHMFRYNWIPNESKARPRGNSFTDWVPFFCGWIISGNRGGKGIMDILSQMGDHDYNRIRPTL